ncbi:ATP-dependent RNA helicase HrpA [Streptomyces sp. DSM 44915]|uniref:ATP-dependent RNA helicase HrpA n=1 Tax=Streptomyces chisholmiae TaxID=3075540 RepID=A0ABU2JYJ1_9ACTN|nr:ATP-dependent RNA helicase HrpA [Streptomyces sp. DSM 44915]MDT0270078.1 ATP-dependent RNA helicase HrpA [Streptomyces sp. DSM 44915]
MSTDASPLSFSALAERLSALALGDELRLGRRLEGARRIRKPAAQQAVLAEIGQAVDAAEQRVERRRAAVPRIVYPEQLPVSQKKDEILAAIRDHQVVIVAGETGSGKTTQIPKICLELGRGVRGLIGHTQPRRIAARTVAQRVAEELGGSVGEVVGFKVRFTDQGSDRTLVKLMTDGILLAELQQDRELRQYDTIIIDEAHERSLNIDFLLGYLAQLLPRRPDLKVIITSATIDPERFADHFRDAAGAPAPIVSVSGRTYPVEVRYRPLLEETAGDESGDVDRDQVTAIGDAVDELLAEGPGDILVFLSGEREIRDTADALGKRGLRHTEVLPLYARLSHAEQQRVFQRHTGRRIVLATNVAETSLTVPGIRYVIDPGTARISRYSHRTKVQRLPIEPISQASANQRKGRCGRTSDGVCIRLYSEEDFLSRPEFTDAEILRTNLASVILQMNAAGLGEVARFPFIDPPDHRSIKAGVQLLEELGALVGDRLTETGRKLSRLPVDPRLARMVLEAHRNGCVREVMVIVAALSIQDPRERPAEKQQQADAQHARFRQGPAEESDFLALLALWEYVRERQRALSSSAFRRMCRNEFLNYLRIREWQDIFSQLRQVGRSLDVEPAGEDVPAAAPALVHQSLLAGLLSQVGLKDTEKHEYLGARGAKFAVFPGSALFRKPPRWVMSAELVETSRLWARINARIDPEWIEPLAGHLVKRTYSEPHWEQKQAAVMAYERVTLYGVPVVARRKVNYGRIDAEVSRELFLRHALVEGDWKTNHRFFQDNRRLLAEVEELEHRARRRDILVDDETLFDFYDQRIPDDVVSGAHFDSWWKKKRREDPDLLNFEKSMLINERAGQVTERDYPDVWPQGRLSLTVTYQFEPGADADGVTVHLPLQVLNQVTSAGFDWQIPGLREQLVTELIRSLPKPLRRNCVPAPDFARRFLAGTPAPTEAPLRVALAAGLTRLTGTRIAPEDFDPEKVPAHLRITFRVVDERGRRATEGPGAEDKDLEALKVRFKPRAQAALDRAFTGGRKAAKAAPGGAPQGGGDAGVPERRTGLTSWTVGTLPRVLETRRGGQPVKAYPALVDEGRSVGVRLFDSEADQAAAMARGTRRLVLLNLPSDPGKFAQRKLDNAGKLALASNPHGGVPALFDDLVTAATDQLIAAHGGPAWDEAGFRRLFDAVRADVVELTLRLTGQLREVLAAWGACERRLAGLRSPTLRPALEDVRAQLDGLVHAGFVTEHGARRLPDLLRYLRAVDRRLQQLPHQAQKDLARTAKVREMQDEHAWLLEQFPPGTPVPARAREIRWMIEELRVSFFAHALGTAYPVSEKRIVKAVDALAPAQPS